MSSAAEEAPVIPLFYFPYGRPLSPLQVEMACRELKLALNDIAGDVLGPEDFAPLAKACSLPGYFKTALYHAAGGDKDRPVTKERFCRYYSHLVANFPEESSRAVHVLARDRDYLTQEDLRPLFEDFFAMHPDMRFLEKTPQFREPFIATALTKYFFHASRSWKNMLSIRDFRYNGRQMMALQDFVIFHAVESNKGLPKSVEFWFHCLDFDGDGFITVYDMQYLYEDKRRIVEAHFPCCDFAEVAHEIFERVKPRKPEFIALSDLKRCEPSVVCMIVNTFMLVPVTVR
ncbi:hypothetical protein MRX96_022439 [Rhipicephalus microplus]